MDVPFLTRVLDEIERLRGLLSKEHSSACGLLRADVPCDCGGADRAIESLLECTSLRAQVAQLMQMQARSRLELARMDAALAERRAEIAALRRLLEPAPKDEQEPVTVIALAG